MIYKEEDEASVPYVLDYYNGGISIERLEEAKQINPDEEYWKDIFGIRLLGRDLAYAKRTDPKLYHFLSNYWVTSDLYQKVLEKCGEIGIPIAHVDDLCVPMSNYLSAGWVPVQRDMSKRAKEAEKLSELFLEIEKYSIWPTKLTIEYGHYVRYDEKDDEHRVNPTEKVQVADFMVLRTLVMELRRLLQQDDKFRKTIIESPDLKFNGFNKASEIRKQQKSHLAVITEYLLNKSICKTKTEAAKLAGMLLSIHGHVISEFEFNLPENFKLQEEYGTYEKYVADLSRNQYNSFKKSMEGGS